MAGDPYWGKTVLSLPMDGTEGSAVFTDARGHTVNINTSAGGGVTITAGIPSPVSSAVAAFAYGVLESPASIDFNLGTGDYTFETWFRYNVGVDVPNTQAVIFGSQSYGAGSEYTFCIGYGGHPSLRRWGASTILEPATLTLVTGTWYHLAWARASGTVRVFCNGVLYGSAGDSTDVTYTVGVRIGASTGMSERVPGHLDDLRLTKGIARYTASFVPPAAPNPTIAMKVSGTVVGSSGALAARPVRLYRNSDGALASAATSNATTGAFALDALDASPHYVVALETGTSNAMIFDNITPI